MPSFSSINSLFELSYAGIPFALDEAKSVHMGATTPIGESPTQDVPAKHQPRADLIEELNRIVDQKYLNDFGTTPNFPGRRLAGVAQPTPTPAAPGPNVGIGDYYYPTGASRWSVFRGLATSSQVAAMLAAVQAQTPILQGTLSNIRFFSITPPTTSTLTSTDVTISQTQKVTRTALLQQAASLLLGGGQPIGSLADVFLSVTTGKKTVAKIGMTGSNIAKVTSNNVSIPSPTFTSFTLGISNVPAPFIMRAAAAGTTNVNTLNSIFTYLYMLPPRPLAEHGAGFDGLYLITLVDERWHWQFAATSLKPTAGTTWDDLIGQVANYLGVFIFYEPIAAAYGFPEPDSPLWTNAENAAALLDALAANVGRVVVRGYDGTYTLQSAADAQLIVQVNRQPNLAAALTGSDPITGLDPNLVVRMAGGEIFQSGQSTLKVGDLTSAKNLIIPAGVTVSFPYYVTGDDPVPHCCNQRYLNQRPSAWSEESQGDEYQVSLSAGDCGMSPLAGAPGTFHTIHSTAKALLYQDIEGAPYNAAALQTLALQIATDYYNWQVGTALDETYPGIYAWTPEAKHDIVWSYSAKSRKAATRVMQTVWNKTVKDMQHSLAEVGLTNVPRGVGGRSVAQSWIDSSPGSSGTNIWALQAPLNSGDAFAVLNQVDFLPTQNRWRLQIDSEIILADGTSGGGASLQNRCGGVMVPNGLIVGPDKFSDGQLVGLNFVGGVPVWLKDGGALFPTAMVDIPQNQPIDGPVIFKNACVAVSKSGNVAQVFGGEYIGWGKSKWVTDIAVFVSGARLKRTGNISLWSGQLVSGSSIGNVVTIAARSIDATFRSYHASGAAIIWSGTSATYGVNAVRYEKSQFAYPSETGDGVQAVNVVPEIQTVYVYSASGSIANQGLYGKNFYSGLNYYSGQVSLFDPSLRVPSPYRSGEYVWLVERNNATITSGAYRDGQLIGYSTSFSGAKGWWIDPADGINKFITFGSGQGTAPVYLVGGGGTTATVTGDSFLAKLTNVRAPFGKKYEEELGRFTKYEWIRIIDSDSPDPITYSNTPTQGTFDLNPAYHIRGIGRDLHQLDDLPIPTVVYLRKGTGAYYLIDASLSWEFCQKVGPLNSLGYFPGNRLRFVQGTKALQVVLQSGGTARPIFLVDVNLP